MNIKKRVLSALAAVTAFAAVSAVTVGATGLGYSDGDIVASETVEIALSDTETATATLSVDDLAIEVSIPVDAFEVDTVNFNATVIESADVVAALNKVDGTIKSTKSLDLYFTDSNGAALQPSKDIDVTFKGVSYDTVYYYDPDTTNLENMNATLTDGNLKFTATHFSVYSLVEFEDETSPSTPVEPSTDNGSSTPTSDGKPGSVLTGDSSTGFIVIVSAVALAAIATAVIATKAKKSSK